MIKINKLNIYYADRQAIKDMSIQIDKSGIYTLVGANGAGKSTLMKSLILDPGVTVEGEIYIHSHIISKKSVAKNISFMPQIVISASPYTAIEVVMMGHKDYLYSFVEKKHIKERALYVMDKLGILKFKDRNIQTLSGGEKAKVFLAKTLCKDVDIILLDEPDSALDFNNKIQFYALLNEIKMDKIILMASHDILSISFTDYLIPFYDNSSYEIISKSDIRKNTIENIYPSLDTDFLSKNLYGVLKLFH